MLSPEAALVHGGHWARALSALLGALGVCVAALLWRQLAAVLEVGSVPSMAVREGLAAAWLLPGAGMLLLMVLAQRVARFLSGKSGPGLGRDGPFLVHNQAVITDTVEQLMIFARVFWLWRLARRRPRQPGCWRWGACSALPGWCSGWGRWRRRWGGRPRWR